MVQPITKPDSPDRTKRIVLAIVLTFYCVSFAYILTRQPLILVRSDHFSRWYAARMLFMEGRSLYDPKNGKEVVAMNTIPVDPIEGSFFIPPTSCYSSRPRYACLIPSRISFGCA